MYLHLSGRSAQHKFFFSFPFYFVLFFCVGVWGLEDSISEILLGQVRDGLWPLQSQWFFVLVFILFCLLLVTSSLPGLQSVLLGPFICVFFYLLIFVEYGTSYLPIIRKEKKPCTYFIVCHTNILARMTWCIFDSIMYWHFNLNALCLLQ